jgi:hypothetical protein
MLASLSLVRSAKCEASAVSPLEAGDCASRHGPVTQAGGAGDHCGRAGALRGHRVFDKFRRCRASVDEKRGMGPISGRHQASGEGRAIGVWDDV